MQVELTLNVEKLLPECLRRRWVVKGQVRLALMVEASLVSSSI